MDKTVIAAADRRMPRLSRWKKTAAGEDWAPGRSVK
jgi:hypothetical protein